MKALVDSLSLTSGAILIAVLSVCIVWLLCVLGPKVLYELWPVVVPFPLAYCIYWLPVWFSNGTEYDRALMRSENHNWQLLFVVAWFLAGAVPSAAVVALMRKRNGR